jgi:predicted site-specific integrase-resolvase
MVGNSRLLTILVVAQIITKTDVLEIITVFSARLYGSRSHKNKKIVDELKEVAKKL